MKTQSPSAKALPVEGAAETEVSGGAGTVALALALAGLTWVRSRSQAVSDSSGESSQRARRTLLL
jgi:hypothetical protein